MEYCIVQCSLVEFPRVKYSTVELRAKADAFMGLPSLLGIKPTYWLDKNIRVI